jgi:4-alpha-glucanotransferase
MRVGLISDLAVGMNPGGSHAWSRQQDLLLGLNIGAPPDLINARGQDWGLTGFSPQSLAASGYEPFIATLRAALRHAGGVRIDHVMGLARLWLVPHGAPPTAGAYLAYPLEDLLRITALESHRHNAIVIGEDLGTVEPAFRRRLAAAGIAGMDVLWFQRRGRAFLPPRRWRSDAVAMTTTHDLPTVAGWWSGADIETRAAIGLAAATEKVERAKDRASLWRAFGKASVANADQPASQDTGPAVDAAIAYTAQSPASLALIPVEDVLGLREQPNLPGTIDEHPNWRRRLPHSTSKLLDAPTVRARLKALRER